jgi:dimethylamine/trimethylamine dehydrogenase
MPDDPKFKVLFEPVTLGPKTTPNRFWQTPQCTGAGSWAPGFQAEFRAMKAEGGYGAIFTEACSIAPENDAKPYVVVELWDEGDVRNLRLLTDRVHEFGSLMGIQLQYSASLTPTNDSRMPILGVSDTASDWIPVAHGGAHQAMDCDGIREMRRLYVASALRARDAGFDLITLHMGHAASVLARFLLPFYNRRTDEYGGSFENRSRLAREVMESVREAVGDDCAIGLRFGVDTLPLPHGLGAEGTPVEEGHAFIEHMDHLVDYWDIVVGGGNWGEDAGSSRTHPENHQQPFVKDVKKHTTKPVVNVGRFTNPDTMVDIIEGGQCDLIGQARPSISDPFLPTKIKEGRLDDIRECIGCNVCVSRWEQGGPRIVCTQNATSGEEYRRGWHPERFSKATNADRDVLVVGAGPAGLECAMVLGKRGMRRVHLVDAGDSLGGALRWIARLPGRGEWGRVIDYRAVQIAKLDNVEVIPDTRLDAEEILNYGAEIVVLATGSTWRRDGLTSLSQVPLDIDESARASVFTPEDIMVDGRTPGNKVVIYDTDGYYMGVGLAEHLVRNGHDVTLAVPGHEVAPYTEYTLELPRINEDLDKLGVQVVTSVMATSVSESGVALESLGRHPGGRIEADGVVLVTQRQSNDALYIDLKNRDAELAAAGIEALYRIGDAAIPHFISEAVFSGHRLAREIDAPNPAVALPPIRERRIVGSSDADYALANPSLSPMY